jgi:sterol desaturase/sphingolipid hydroxylase (fatty acid hydroxylase superfamily)
MDFSDLLFAIFANARIGADAFFHILPHDVGRYVITAGGVFVIVNLAFASRLAGRKIREKSAAASQMRREFMTSLRTAVIFSLSGALTVLAQNAGAITMLGAPENPGWGYFAVNLAAIIIAHDAWFYWTHRLIHHPRLFRRAHRTHHKSHIPTPWTAYSFDMTEAAINAAYLPLFLIVMPTSILVIIVFLTHMIVRNVIGHCGYELFPARRDGRPLVDWLTTVTHHDLHHAQAGWNYGLYFTWWDRLMGTEHPLYHEKFAAAVRIPLDGSAVAAIAPALTQPESATCAARFDMVPSQS